MVTNVAGGVGWKYTSDPGGCGCEPFHIVNALEAVTEEGEFSFDFKDQKVYVYIPTSSADASEGGLPDTSLLTITDNAKPVLKIECGAHGVAVRG
jgi:hypothetical protein